MTNLPKHISNEIEYCGAGAYSRRPEAHTYFLLYHTEDLVLEDLSVHALQRDVNDYYRETS